MTRAWWYVLLAVTGIIASRQIADVSFTLLFFGVWCVSLGLMIAFGGAYGVVIWKMDRMNMIRWWHLVIVGVVGAVVYYIGLNMTMGPICIQPYYNPIPID